MQIYILRMQALIGHIVQRGPSSERHQRQGRRDVVDGHGSAEGQCRCPVHLQAVLTGSSLVHITADD